MYNPKALLLTQNKNSRHVCPEKNCVNSSILSDCVLIQFHSPVTHSG